MKDNTPAFPTGIITDDVGLIVGGSNGMNLRDYFAAKAMQALIDNDGLFSEIPTQAYKLADAMMEARK